MIVQSFVGQSGLSPLWKAVNVGQMAGGGAQHGLNQADPGAGSRLPTLHRCVGSVSTYRTSATTTWEGCSSDVA